LETSPLCYGAVATFDTNLDLARVSICLNTNLTKIETFTI